jgi:di/tricarboxylate transporter
MTVWLITIILLVTIYLLVSEKYPIDLTAIGLIAVLMITGILTPSEALAGFANPSVITIVAMLVLSSGLIRTGALSFLTEKIARFLKGDEKRILLVSTIGVAIPSAFIGHTPIVVLFVPILMSICCGYGMSPSKFLIPVSYASIAGGTMTLIGTATHLLISSFATYYGYGPLGMFEFSPVGVPIMVVTLLFLYFTSSGRMPSHKAPVCELRGSGAPQFLSELLVPDGSKLIGKTIAGAEGNLESVEIFEIVRNGVILLPEDDGLRILEKDMLLVKGSASDIIGLLDLKLVVLPHELEGTKFPGKSGEYMILEMIISPQSRLIGESPIGGWLQRELGIRIIAVKRRGIHYSEQKLSSIRLTIGDVLLVGCKSESLDEIRSKPDFIVIEDVHHQVVGKTKASLALGIFVASIAAAATRVADISICTFTGAFVMVLTGCITLRGAYRSISVKVLIMIVGMMALGTALEKTGAAMVYTDLFLTPLKGLDPKLILSAFILLTCILTELMSHITTSVLLVPVAVTIATSLGVNPKAFIFGVCFGASCGFASPISYHTHLLVFGPGGYRFKDFLKLGIPLDILIWILSSLLIPLVWPL